MDSMMLYSYLVVLPDLSYKVAESFVHVDALFRRRLDELAAKVLGQITTLYCLTH